MNKEIIISLFIVILVIIMNIISQNYTDTKMEKTVLALEQIKEEISSKKSVEEVEKQYDIMYKEWRKNFNVFAYYIEHDELEKVEVELVTLRAYIETDYNEDAISNAERAQYIINHIEEKYRLNFKNIF